MFCSTQNTDRCIVLEYTRFAPLMNIRHEKVTGYLDRSVELAQKVHIEMKQSLPRSKFLCLLSCERMNLMEQTTY